MASGLEAGPCDVVLRDSVFAAGGGPLVRSTAPTPRSERRVFMVESLVAGPGPVIESTPRTAPGGIKPLEIRAFGSVFGRLRGAGIASVIAATDANQPPGKLIDWFGDGTCSAGWMGFFACGADRTVTRDDLAAARSTWNGTDRSSREIPAEWAQLGDIAGVTAADFSSDAPAISPFWIVQRDRGPGFTTRL